jgi:hypothetical protein
MASPIEEIRRQIVETKKRQTKEPALPTPAPVLSSTEISPDTLIGALPSPVVSQQPIIAPAEAPVDAQSSDTPPPVVAPALPAIRASSPPMSASAFTRFLKISISAAILLAGCYFGIKSAYPFLKELAQPGSTATAKPSDTPTSVKVLQQTRAIVAKNNANVDNLNGLINDEVGSGKAALKTSSLPALPEPPPQPKAKPQPQVRLEKLSNVIIDELQVSSVLGGKTPCITIDGLIVGIGGIVDSKRRLRFLSLDETKRVIILGNGQQIIEKPY